MGGELSPTKEKAHRAEIRSGYDEQMTGENKGPPPINLPLAAMWWPLQQSSSVRMAIFIPHRLSFVRLSLC